MLRYAMTSSFPSTTQVPTALDTADGWSHSVERSTTARSSRPGRRLGQRAMGLVATLTLVALVGLSGVAVYLNAPRDNPSPTSLAGVTYGTPDTSTPVASEQVTEVGTPTLAEGIATLDESAYEDVPPPMAYGEDWHIVSAPYLYTLPYTDVQSRVYYYADNDGSRLLLLVVDYGDSTDTASQAFDHFTAQITALQGTLDRAGLDSTLDEIQAEPLAGCSQTFRGDGQERITNYGVGMSLCLDETNRQVIFATVNGYLWDSPGPGQFYPASDSVVTEVLAFGGLAATPVAAR